MNFEELLKASTEGLPKVKSSVPIQNATSSIGKVTVIKNNSRWKGCAVQFPPLVYDVWFEDNPTGTDGRKHYMHQLEFIK